MLEKIGRCARKLDNTDLLATRLTPSMAAFQTTEDVRNFITKMCLHIRERARSGQDVHHNFPS